MENRKMQLLEAEYREKEHREVAEAIQWALETLKGEAGRT